MKTNYIDNQIQKKSINKKRVQQHKLTREDRAQAVDTVIEIHRKYGLVTETLFIAIWESFNIENWNWDIKVKIITNLI